MLEEHFQLLLSNATAETGNSPHVTKPRKLLATWALVGDTSHLAEATQVRMVEAGCQRSPAEAGNM